LLFEYVRYHHEDRTHLGLEKGTDNRIHAYSTRIAPFRPRLKFWRTTPINLPGGTGPNQGYFGTLGRDTFRGPGFQQYDIALIKNTPIGRGGAEWAVLQFRAEFFNIFNIVNFGLPSNTLLGTGFGIISKTAGPSRQIQFSLRLAF
jgi:hypothetical protein